MNIDVNRNVCNNEKTSVLRFRHSLGDVFLKRKKTFRMRRERQQLKPPRSCI